MKYLVMETFNSYAVLLDEEGRFVKSGNFSYEIGDTVTNPVLMRDTPLEKVKGMRKMATRITAGILMIAAMIGLFVGVNFYQQNYAPYTSIFMMINPEVEMILNRNGEVIDLEGANADGSVLLDEYELNSKDKTVVLNELVDRAIEMEFLADGGQVSISIDTPDQDLFKKYGIELRRELDGRTRITIQITDIENKGNPSRPPVVPKPEPVPVPKPTPPVDDDSGYDESDYDEPNNKSNTQAPVRRPVTDDDDSDYDDTDDEDDDSDYDEDDNSDYDDSDYDDDDD